MPMRVPEYNQQFRYQSPNVPAARLQGMQVQTNAAMFGAESGRQLERGGYMLQRAADQTAHLVDDYNTTKARDAARQMQQGFLEWQSEAQKKQGEAGMHTAADYDTWAKSQREELTKGLNDVQRGRFDSLADMQDARFRHWADAYGQQQEQTYHTATQQGIISNEYDMLAKNIQEPALAEMAVEKLHAAALKLSEMQGLGSGSDAEKALVRETLSKGLAPAIHARIQSGDTGTAAALIKQYGGQLGGTAAAQLDTALKREQDTQAREAWAGAREARITARIELGQRAQDAAASYRAGARYDNAPSRDEFIAAYGSQQGDRMYRELEAQRALGEDVQDLRVMTPAEQQALMETRRPEEGEGFADREQKYRALVSAVQHDAELRAQDPVVYLVNYDPAVKETRATMLSSMTPESVSAYATALQSSMEARGMEGAFKKHMPLLAESDARQMAASIASSPEPEKLLANLQQSFGKHWPALERQLSSGEKLPPDISVVASGMTGRSARLLLDAAKNKNFVNDAKVALGAGYKTMQDAVGASLQDALKTFRASGATAIELRVRESTEKLAAAYMWEDGMSARGAAQKAAQDVIAERYSFKGTYRVPKNIDADRVDIGAQMEIARIAESAATLDLPAVPGLSKEAVASRYGSGLLRNATWATNEDESGLILFVGGKPIRNADGSLVRRSWDELREASHPRTLVMTPQAKATLEDMKFEGMQ